MFFGISICDSGLFAYALLYRSPGQLACSLTMGRRFRTLISQALRHPKGRVAHVRLSKAVKRTNSYVIFFALLRHTSCFKDVLKLFVQILSELQSKKIIQTILQEFD